MNLPQLFGGDKKEGGLVGTLQIRSASAASRPSSARTR